MIKKYIGILQLRFEMYCQFINIPIGFKKKTKQKNNNEYSYDCWQAEKFRIEKLLLLISFSRNQKSFLKIIKLPVFIIIIIIIIIIMALALTKSNNFI